MHPQQRQLTLLILLGGPLVLASYVEGIFRHPDTAPLLWGAVPEAVIPYYTANMFVAAAGFFLFTYHLLWQVEPSGIDIAGRFDFRFFSVCYSLIFLGSMTWMPLSLYAVEHQAAHLEGAIDGVLWVTALASVGVLIGLLGIRPSWPSRSWRLAVLGSLMFLGQTLILDALVWPQFFSL